jgi:hypothetical protein
VDDAADHTTIVHPMRADFISLPPTLVHASLIKTA